VPPEAAELRARLDRVAAGLTGVLDELREFARGIHPAILADGGLGRAVKTLARRCPIPVSLDVQAGGRLPEPAEVCAYYVISEALANAAKHSRATAITVQVTVAGGALTVRVCDTEPAAPASAPGPG
jgi:signal transduction histidine kinase